MVNVLYRLLPPLTISGSREFVDKIVKVWETIKPYLEELERKALISESELLKVDAYLDSNGIIVIFCDNPTVENIRPLMNLVRAQLLIRREYENLYSHILLMYEKQVFRLATRNREIADFVKKKYREYGRSFIEKLIVSLERALSLERLSDGERGDLERVENIREPFKESVKMLPKTDLYLVMVDSLWRRVFGWKPPDFVLSAGVDINGLEEIFDAVLDVLRFQRYTMAGRAVYAIIEFTLKIFGVDINEILSPEKLDKDYYIT